MPLFDKVLELAENNNGYVTYTMLLEHDISTIVLTRANKSGKLVRLDRGIYILPNQLNDEFYVFSLKYKKLIFSRRTALYLNEMSNRFLDKIDGNFPNNYNSGNIFKLQPHRVNKIIYETGKTKIKTPLGNGVFSYDRERCFCDLFLFNECDMEERQYAVKKFLESKYNPDKLYEYAKKLGILEKVKAIIEVK